MDTISTDGMVLKGVLLIILAVITGILALVSFIMFLVYWGTPGKRNTWAIIFGISFLVSVSSVAYTVISAVRKARQMSSMLVEKAMEDLENGRGDVWTDDRSYLMEPGNANAQLDLIRSYQPDSVEVPDEYYTYFGYRDWNRMPLRYPYSLQCIDGLEYAQLCDDSGVLDYPTNAGARQLQLYDITHFSFDKDLLLLRISENPNAQATTEKEKIKYVLFYFADEKEETFPSEAEMLAKAQSLGFAGAETLMTPAEYDMMF